MLPRSIVRKEKFTVGIGQYKGQLYHKEYQVYLCGSQRYLSFILKSPVASAIPQRKKAKLACGLPKVSRRADDYSPPLCGPGSEHIVQGHIVQGTNNPRKTLRRRYIKGRTVMAPFTRQPVMQRIETKQHQNTKIRKKNLT